MQEFQHQHPSLFTVLPPLGPACCNSDICGQGNSKTSLSLAHFPGLITLVVVVILSSPFCLNNFPSLYWILSITLKRMLKFIQTLAVISTGLFRASSTCFPCQKLLLTSENVLREMHIKCTLRYHFSYINSATTKISLIADCWWEFGENKHSHTLLAEV